MQSPPLMLPQTTDVCRIGTTGYATLSAAIDAISSGTAASNPGGSYTIKVLVSNYDITSTLTLPQNKDITITTAASAGSSCVLNRSASLTNGPLFNITVSTSSLHLTNITMDGGWSSGINSDSPLIICSGGKIYLDTGAVLRNNNCISESGNSTAGAIMVKSAGHVYMQDGACIKNCKARYGGGITLYNGKMDLSGGSIENCIGTKSFYDSGSAIEIWSGSVFTMTGGSITGNKCEGQGAAIVLESNSDKAYLSGGSITGNYSNGTNGAGFYRNGGTVYLSGGITINGNLGGSIFDTNHNVTPGTQKRDLYTASGASANIIVTGNLTGTIGMYISPVSAMAAGVSFATTEAANASAINGLGNFFSDINDGTETDLHGTSSTAGDNKVIWKGDAVCKIGSTPYYSLQQAFDAISSGTATTDGSTGSYRIEMLVSSYKLSYNHTVPQGKNITITTADIHAADGYSYRGAEGTQAMLVRNAQYSGTLFSVPSGTTLNLGTITVDGAWGSNHAGTMAASYLIGNSGTLNLNNNAVLQNNYSSATANTAGAIFNTGTLNMNEGSGITNCEAQYGGGVANNGGVFTMNGGSIDHCYSYRQSGDSGSAIDSWSNGTFTMNGGIITDNASLSASGAGGGAIVQESGTCILTGGTITNNTGHGTGGGFYRMSGTLKVSGSIDIENNNSGCTYTSYTVSNKGRTSNLYLAGGYTFIADGGLTGKVGISSITNTSAPAGTNMQERNQFAVTSDSDASTVEGLINFFNDNNTGSEDDDLFGTFEAAGNNAVVWGSMRKLAIQKEVTGNMGDRAREWEFSIALTMGNTGNTGISGAFTYTINGGEKKNILFTNGTISQVDGNDATAIKLQSGDRFVLSKLPPNAGYQITEVNYAADYAIRYTTLNINKQGTSINTADPVTVRNSNETSGSLAYSSTYGVTYGGKQVVFTNEKIINIPTGVKSECEPFVRMLIIAIILFITFLAAAMRTYLNGKED